MSDVRLNTVLLAWLLATVPAIAGGTEVYRWVDEDGVVHFSQTEPVATDAAVETLTIEDDRPADYDPDADIYGVAEQAERMQALREDMREKREAALERQRRQPQPVTVRREPEYFTFPVYRRPWLRPPLRPHPRPPAQRPPGAGDWIKPPSLIEPPPVEP